MVLTKINNVYILINIMSNRMTIQQVADELGVSTKTLRRWEEKGYFAIPYERDSVTNARLYHPWPVSYWKKLLNLDRSLKTHLKVLSSLRKELDKHMLEQDYIPGKPLKLLDLESFTKAYDAMEVWEKEFKRLLNEFREFPRDMRKVVSDNYDKKEN